ncbi:MAG: 16S rRNA (guanine(527)-N(7))-methyltransferase RsmG [Candidatus Nanopelagicales bacterium]
MQTYTELLQGPGVERGLIGPREATRLWERHVANSAVVAELIADQARVVDVGSGAGLPGLPIALVRPDLTVVLVEPLLRRWTFLQEAVVALGVADRVEVVRARAEELPRPFLADPDEGAAAGSATVVTARAVAPLDRLVAWTLALVPLGGELLALKGENAEAEARSALGAIAALGGGAPEVVRCGVGVVEPATTVVRIERRRLVRDERVAR